MAAGPQGGNANKQINIDENERIVGIKARCSAATSWQLYDLQFVIGKYENV